MSSNQLDHVHDTVLRLLADIRPNVVALVDAFDFPDALLCSVLGRYDGQVYDNLYSWAAKSPLNKEPVSTNSLNWSEELNVRFRGRCRHFQHVWPNRGPSKTGATFSGLWGLFVACLNIYKLTWCSTTFSGLGLCMLHCKI